MTALKIEMMDQLGGGPMSLEVIARLFGKLEFARAVLESYVTRGLIEIHNADGIVEPHWRLREILRDGGLAGFNVDLTNHAAKEFSAFDAGKPNVLESRFGHR